MYSFTVSASSDPLIFLEGMLVAGLILTGVTVLLAYLLTSLRNPRERAFVAVLLLVIFFLCITITLMFPDILPPVAPLACTIAVLLLLPLAIVFPGTLRFWAGGRPKILVMTFLCAGATSLVLVIFALVLFFLPPAGLFVALLNNFLNALAYVPLGIPLFIFALFLVATAIAMLNYRFLGWVRRTSAYIA